MLLDDEPAPSAPASEWRAYAAKLRARVRRDGDPHGLIKLAAEGAERTAEALSARERSGERAEFLKVVADEQSA